MFVVYNYPGLAMAVAGFGSAEGLKKLGMISSTHDVKYAFLAFSIMLVLDIAFRIFMRNRQQTGTDAASAAVPANGVKWLIQPAAGGSLFFLPAWALAIIGFLFFTLKD